MDEEIIKLYCDEYFSIPDLMKKGFKKSEIYKALENVKKRSRIESLKIARENPNKFKWSEEKKKTISQKRKEDNKNKPKRVATEKARTNLSKGMIKAHKEGKAHCWNSSKQESYPEKFFRVFLENIGLKKNIDFFQEYPIGRFRADFFFPYKKTIIEIDGGQHERWNRKEYDTRKDLLAKSLGYTIIRIWWKVLFNDTQEILKLIQTVLEKQNHEIKIEEITLRQALILGKLKEKKEQKDKELIRKHQERQFVINSLFENRLVDAKEVLGTDNIISKLSLKWNVEKHFVKRFFNKHFPDECVTRVTCKCGKQLKTMSSYLRHKKVCLEH